MSAALADELVRRLFADQGPAPDVDWARFRLMQLIPGTAGVTDAALRDQLIARGFEELEKGSFDAETERRSIVSLRTLVRQLLGEQPRVIAYENPMVGALGRGPAPHAPPNLKRLLTAVAEIVSRATPVSIAAEGDAIGERIMTLLFVEGRYVGFLPGKRELGPHAGRA